jgi:hypothetical protein
LLYQSNAHSGKGKDSNQSDKHAEAKTIYADTETVSSSGESFGALPIGCLSALFYSKQDSDHVRRSVWKIMKKTTSNASCMHARK